MTNILIGVLMIAIPVAIYLIAKKSGSTKNGKSGSGHSTDDHEESISNPKLK